MDKNEIMTILPHREGMLLVDEAFVTDNVAHGVYQVRGDEWFLAGHFPGDPIVPGVILCEMLAQATCVLLADELPAGALPLFTGLDHVRFKAPVRPGDRLESECVITRRKPPFYFAAGKGLVNGRLCVQAEFSFAVTQR